MGPRTPMGGDWGVTLPGGWLCHPPGGVRRVSPLPWRGAARPHTDILLVAKVANPSPPAGGRRGVGGLTRLNPHGGSQVLHPRESPLSGGLSRGSGEGAATLATGNTLLEDKRASEGPPTLLALFSSPSEMRAELWRIL